MKVKVLLLAGILLWPGSAHGFLAGLRCHFVFDRDQIVAELQVMAEEKLIEKMQESNNGFMKLGGKYLGKRRERKNLANPLDRSHTALYYNLRDSGKELRDTAKKVPGSVEFAKDQVVRSARKVRDEYDREKAKGFPTMLGYANDKFYQWSMGTKTPPTLCGGLDEQEENIEELFLQDNVEPSLRLRKLQELDQARQARRIRAALAGWSTALSSEYRVRALVKESVELANEFAEFQKNRPPETAPEGPAAPQEEAPDEDAPQQTAAEKEAARKAKIRAEAEKPIGKTLLKGLAASARKKKQEDVYSDFLFAARAKLLEAKIKRERAGTAIAFMNLDLQKGISQLPGEIPKGVDK